MTVQSSAHVIVLGDLSRSPRILSQAKYLAKDGWKVTISGHAADQIQSSIPNIRALNIMASPDFRKLYLPNVIALGLKFIITAIILFMHVLINCRSKLILIQNPPSVPTFFVLWLFVKLSRKSLVIDWHNYGYTLMGLSTSHSSLSTRIYHKLEVGFASRFFNANNSCNIQHLCVSLNFKRDLEKHNISAVVYYDRPSEEFKTISCKDAHNLLTRLSITFPQLADPNRRSRFTRFTELTALPTDNHVPQWRPDRPALIVCSCSWTADDDFDLLLEALNIYNNLASKLSELPDIVVAVTGKGPLQSHYMNMIKQFDWEHVNVMMLWLDWCDYPSFVSCADLGVSFHRSSSGLDLPMKIVDMLGVGVPVLALEYPTLIELLPDNSFGICFSNSTQLANQLGSLLQKTDRNPRESGRFAAFGSEKLISFRQSLQRHNDELMKGYEYWKTVALPVYKQSLIRGKSHCDYNEQKIITTK